jgi:hypothetical protein
MLVDCFDIVDYLEETWKSVHITAGLTPQPHTFLFILNVKNHKPLDCNHKTARITYDLIKLKRKIRNYKESTATSKQHGEGSWRIQTVQYRSTMEQQSFVSLALITTGIVPSSFTVLPT